MERVPHRFANIVSLFLAVTGLENWLMATEW
jgi:hypothetical protein